MTGGGWYSTMIFSLHIETLLQEKSEPTYKQWFVTAYRK